MNMAADQTAQAVVHSVLAGVDEDVLEYICGMLEDFDISASDGDELRETIGPFLSECEQYEDNEEAVAAACAEIYEQLRGGGGSSAPAGAGAEGKDDGKLKKLAETVNLNDLDDADALRVGNVMIAGTQESDALQVGCSTLC